MIWCIAFVMVGILIIGMVMFLKGVHKVNTKDKVLVRYLFVYKIVEGDAKGLPTEFLVNWKITDLENHLYLLYLTLEEDLDIEGYLHKVWVDYEGFDDVYIDVYRIEGMMDTKHTLIGKFCIIEGKMGYTPV